MLLKKLKKIKLNQNQNTKGHSHYIIIKELSSVMNTYKREIIGLNNFYQINIIVSESFYNNFKTSGEVFLSVEFNNDEIIDFDKYFKHSISLTFHSEIMYRSHNILECKLEDIACF